MFRSDPQEFSAFSIPCHLKPLQPPIQFVLSYLEWIQSAPSHFQAGWFADASCLYALLTRSGGAQS